jgi:hypothetical protein
VAKLHKRLTGGEPDVHEVRPDLPEPLAELIRCALSLDPAQRFATAAAFADAVESFLESSQLRPSAKTLSDALERPYMDVRAKLTSVIEEQLKRISRDGSRDSGLLVLDPGDGTSSLSGVLSSLRSDSAFRARTEQGRAVHVGSHADKPRAAPSLSVSSVSILRSRADDARDSAAPSRPGPLRGSTRAQIAKLAVVVGVVALASFGALSSPRQVREATKTASTAAAPSSAARGAALVRPTATALAQLPQAEAPTATSTIAVEIRVSPSSAQVKLDGATLPELPFHAQLRRDSLVHRVEASAPGYVAATMAIPFDRDRQLSVVLRREVAGNGLARAAAASPVRSTSIKPGAQLVAKRRSSIHLDTTDPYAN